MAIDVSNSEIGTPQQAVDERIRSILAEKLGLEPRQITADHIALARRIRQQGGLRGTNVGERLNLLDHIEQRFYVIETMAPMRLYPHQKCILYYARVQNKFQTNVYSTIKKSGKTTVTSAVARHTMENSGPYAETYCLANDQEGARGRIWMGVQKSLELTPGYDKGHKQFLLPNGEIEFKTVENEIRHAPTGAICKAVALDYRGEAGSNPNATFWSELWGAVKEDAKRMWAELTPVPTRPDSFRWVETYAGYEDERGILWDVYMTGRDPKSGARQLNCHDFLTSPYPWPWINECNCSITLGCDCGHIDDIGYPMWVNTLAGQFTYWDEGQRARRMGWQLGEAGSQYYSIQKASLDDLQYLRLHENRWISSVEAFLPIEWWDACVDTSIPTIRPGSKMPLVAGVDAAVSSDCIAMQAVGRDPRDKSKCVKVLSRVWYPPKGGKFDYGASDGLKETMRQWAKDYNIVQFAYDPYQLHDVMQEMTRAGVAWCREFSQGTERSAADKRLHSMIRDRQFVHDGSDSETRQHIINAARKMSLQEDTKFRIVKKGENSGKIDLLVALSMATSECMRLDLS